MEERELSVGVAGAGFAGAVRAAVMQFEPDGGAMGTTVISQISEGRKNRLGQQLDACPAHEPMEVAP